MSDEMPRPLRQIDSLTATVDQLGRELESVTRQVLILLACCFFLTATVGVLLWQSK